MTTEQKEYHDALVCNRDIFEQSASGIDAEIKRLKEQRHLLYMDYKTRKAALHRKYNTPTEHSHISNRRKTVFNLQRKFGGIFNGFKTGTLDTENVRVSFDMQDDRKQVQFTITVPYRDFMPDENQG